MQNKTESGSNDNSYIDLTRDEQTGNVYSFDPSYNIFYGPRYCFNEDYVKCTYLDNEYTNWEYVDTSSDVGNTQMLSPSTILWGTALLGYVGAEALFSYNLQQPLVLTNAIASDTSRLLTNTRQYLSNKKKGALLKAKDSWVAVKSKVKEANLKIGNHFKNPPFISALIQVVALCGLLHVIGMLGSSAEEAVLTQFIAFFVTASALWVTPNYMNYNQLPGQSKTKQLLDLPSKAYNACKHGLGIVAKKGGQSLTETAHHIYRTFKNRSLERVLIGAGAGLIAGSLMGDTGLWWYGLQPTLCALGGIGTSLVVDRISTSANQVKLTTFRTRYIEGKQKTLDWIASIEPMDHARATYKSFSFERGLIGMGVGLIAGSFLLDGSSILGMIGHLPLCALTTMATNYGLNRIQKSDGSTKALVNSTWNIYTDTKTKALKAATTKDALLATVQGCRAIGTHIADSIRNNPEQHLATMALSQAFISFGPSHFLFWLPKMGLTVLNIQLLSSLAKKHGHVPTILPWALAAMYPMDYIPLLHNLIPAAGMTTAMIYASTLGPISWQHKQQIKDFVTQCKASLADKQLLSFLNSKISEIAATQNLSVGGQALLTSATFGASLPIQAAYWVHKDNVQKWVRQTVIHRVLNSRIVQGVSLVAPLGKIAWGTLSSAHTVLTTLETVYQLSTVDPKKVSFLGTLANITKDDDKWQTLKQLFTGDNLNNLGTFVGHYKTLRSEIAKKPDLIAHVPPAIQSFLSEAFMPMKMVGFIHENIQAISNLVISLSHNGKVGKEAWPIILETLGNLTLSEAETKEILYAQSNEESKKRFDSLAEEEMKQILDDLSDAKTEKLRDTLSEAEIKKVLDGLSKAKSDKVFDTIYLNIGKPALWPIFDEYFTEENLRNLKQIVVAYINMDKEEAEASTQPNPNPKQNADKDQGFIARQMEKIEAFLDLETMPERLLHFASPKGASNLVKWLSSLLTQTLFSKPEDRANKCPKIDGRLPIWQQWLLFTQSVFNHKDLSLPKVNSVLSFLRLAGDVFQKDATLRQEKSPSHVLQALKYRYAFGVILSILVPIRPLYDLFLGDRKDAPKMWPIIGLVARSVLLITALITAMVMFVPMQVFMVYCVYETIAWSITGLQLWFQIKPSNNIFVRAFNLISVAAIDRLIFFPVEMLIKVCSTLMTLHPIAYYKTNTYLFKKLRLTYQNGLLQMPVNMIKFIANAILMVLDLISFILWGMLLKPVLHLAYMPLQLNWRPAAFAKPMRADTLHEEAPEVRTTQDAPEAAGEPANDSEEAPTFENNGEPSNSESTQSTEPAEKGLKQNSQDELNAVGRLIRMVCA